MTVRSSVVPVKQHVVRPNGFSWAHKSQRRHWRCVYLGLMKAVDENKNLLPWFEVQEGGAVVLPAHRAALWHYWCVKTTALVASSVTCRGLTCLPQFQESFLCFPTFHTFIHPLRRVWGACKQFRRLIGSSLRVVCITILWWSGWDNTRERTARLHLSPNN